jgi:Spy/CpxP family protein refolding chaperone
MKKRMTAVVVIALAVIAAAPAMAYRDMRVGYGSGPGNVEDIAAERGLDLTAEQKEKINTLREAHLKDVRPLQDQLYVKGRELKDLWLAKTPDRESILTLQREVQALRNQLMDKLTTYRLDVLQLLTPEQQAKVRPYGPERRPPRMGGPGMRGDHENGRGMRGPGLMPPPAGAAP